VPITTEQLIDKGYLCEVDYYGGRQANLDGVKNKQLPTGGTDYDPQALSDATEKDGKLVGDIIKNWLKWAEGQQTIAFAPSIKHSKELVRQFNEAGIAAEHIDGYMDEQERQFIYDSHDKGHFLILSSSRLLNTGYDCPPVSCCIDCFPTKSKIVWQQRIGRVLRVSEGKNKAIVLDHAGNYGRHGPAESIVPFELDDGEKKYSEKSSVTETKKKSEPSLCPQCTNQMLAKRCKCGFEYEGKKEDLVSTSEILVKLSPEQRNRKHTNQDKSVFYSELLLYSRTKGYKDGGWASHQYKNRYGVWPNSIKPQMLTGGISEETKKYITSTQIRYSKKRSAA
jgi:superfamily II DNA or RNA helicase